MKPGFDIQFFGGRSKTRQVRKRDPNPWLENIQAQLNNVFSTSLAPSMYDVNSELCRVHGRGRMLRSDDNGGS